MSVIGLDHVQLAMPRGEEARARAFYAGVLGLAEMPKPEAERGGCWFVGGAAHIHLGVEDGFATPGRRIRRCWWMICAPWSTAWKQPVWRSRRDAGSPATNAVTSPTRSATGSN